MFYLGGNTTERGEAIVMKNKLMNNVTQVQCINDCMMYVKISVNPVDFLILQVYMLTSNHDVAEVRAIYNKTGEILHKKGIGYVNTRIETSTELSEKDVSRNFWMLMDLARINDRKKMFCKLHNLY